jgi:hypothetical protein
MCSCDFSEIGHQPIYQFNGYQLNSPNFCQCGNVGVARPSPRRSHGVLTHSRYRVHAVSQRRC